MRFPSTVWSEWQYNMSFFVRTSRISLNGVWTLNYIIVNRTWRTGQKRNGNEKEKNNNYSYKSPFKNTSRVSAYERTKRHYVTSYFTRFSPYARITNTISRLFQRSRIYYCNIYITCRWENENYLFSLDKLFIYFLYHKRT